MVLLEIYFKLNFAIALLAAELLICLRVGRRKNWILRFVCGAVLVLLLAYFWPNVIPLLNVVDPKWFVGVGYLLTFSVTLIVLALTFYCNFWSLLLVGVTSYCLQHFSWQLFNVISGLIGDGLNIAFGFLLSIAIIAATYTAFYFLFVKRLQKGKEIQVNNYIQVLISLVALVVVVYLSLFGASFIGNENKAGQIVLELFSILFCLVVTALEYSSIRVKEEETESKILKFMLHNAKNQYEKSEENIELINLKYHDLKHQIFNLHGRVSDDELKKIAESVDFYDIDFRTGNDALDIVLMEKGVNAKGKGVRMTCMLDVASIKNMKEGDIYSLFGNALDNAISAVMDLEEEKRSISISGVKLKEEYKIRIDNYYSGDISFSDGLPLTKRSKDYHGYGMKSMKALAERYKGKMDVFLHDDIFTLEFTFPA